MSSDASDDEYLEVFRAGRLSIDQTRRVSEQVTMNEAAFVEHVRSVLRSVDPLGLRIVAHPPKVEDREISRALRIPAKFVTEYRAHIVQKMMSPAMGSLMKALGALPSQGSAPTLEKQPLGTAPHAPDADHERFEAAARDFLSELERLSSVNTIIDREMEQFAPIAEGVAQMVDMAAARGFTIKEFGREVLRDALGEKETVANIFVPKAIEEISEVRLELLDRLRSRVDDLQKLRSDVVERVVAELLASRGFHDVRWVGRNPRTSADIIAAQYLHAGRKRVYFVEVKRWKERVGVQVIDHVYGAMLAERPRMGWHAAMVVSLYGFKSFRKYSREDLLHMGVNLKGRDDLVHWLKEYRPSPNGLWLPPGT
jgi:hypothetical protein